MAASLEALASPGHYSLSGDVNFDTVPDLWRQGEALFDSGADIALDLAGVARMDSAGLALLVGWIARARRGDHELTLSGAPAQLRAIARVTGVGTILALENGDGAPDR